MGGREEDPGRQPPRPPGQGARPAHRHRDRRRPPHRRRSRPGCPSRPPTRSATSATPAWRCAPAGSPAPSKAPSGPPSAAPPPLQGVLRRDRLHLPSHRRNPRLRRPAVGLPVPERPNCGMERLDSRATDRRRERGVSRVEVVNFHRLKMRRSVSHAKVGISMGCSLHMDLVVGFFTDRNTTESVVFCIHPILLDLSSRLGTC